MSNTLQQIQAYVEALSYQCRFMQSPGLRKLAKDVRARWVVARPLRKAKTVVA